MTEQLRYEMRTKSAWAGNEEIKNRGAPSTSFTMNRSLHALPAH